jgi:tetratricopeptide (TPR) repeat protein
MKITPSRRKNVEKWEFACQTPNGKKGIFRLEKDGSFFTIFDAEGPVKADSKLLEEKVLLLLEYFLRNAGERLERADIEEEFWNASPSAADLLAQYLGRLRKLLNDEQVAGKWRIIETTRGAGLKFVGEIISSPDAAVHEDACPLPALGHFVGREEDRAIASTRWHADRKRPLLIWGTPGIGKSTLALALLHEPQTIQQFGNRRFRLRCDGLLTADAVKAEMGREWFGLNPGNPQAGGLRQIEREIIGQLSAAPAACIIDNFETPHRKDPLESENWLRTLLAIEGLWLIVGTQGYYQPAGVPWSKPVEPSLLSSEQACELFSKITNIAAHRHDLRLPAILQEMSGIPHAIELLAHQADMLEDLSPLLARWAEKGTRMLQRMGGRSRETSLAVAYNFAIDENPFVDEAARLLLRSIACLPKGVRWDDISEIALTVGQTSPVDGAEILTRSALAFRESNRLRLLAPLRDYVLRNRPASSGELKRVLDCYLKISMEAEDGPTVGTQQGGGIVDRLSEEFPNLEWAIEKGLDLRDRSAISAARALAKFTSASGLGEIQLLSRAENLARELDEPWLEVESIFSAAEMAFHKHQFKIAQAGFQRALRVYAVCSPLGEANCLVRLGELARLFGKLDEATELIHQAMAKYDGDGPFELRGRAQCHRELANIAEDRHDRPGSFKETNEALSIFLRLGDRNGEASCHISLGRGALFCREYEAAHEHFEKAWSINQSLGISTGAAGCLMELGDVEIERAQYGRAADYYIRALDFYRGVKDQDAECLCLCILTDISFLATDYEHSSAYCAAAARIFSSESERSGEAKCSRVAGLIAFQRSDFDEAGKQYQRALTIFQSVPDLKGVAQCLADMGELNARLGDPATAKRDFELALTMFQSAADKKGEIRCREKISSLSTPGPPQPPVLLWRGW